MNSKRKEAPALDYRLDVRDFGPIARASVEMRPLTVFIGPSNTGKSYLAMLLYVLHRCLCLETGGRWQDHPLRRWSYVRNTMWHRAGQDSTVREALTGWVASALTNDNPPPLPEELLKNIHSDLEQPDALALALDHELRRCFGVEDLRTLARRGGGKKPTVNVSGPPETQAPSAEVARYEVKLAAAIEIAGNMPLDLLSRCLVEHLETARSSMDALDDLPVDEVGASIYLSHTIERAIDRFLGAACRQAHYLPADRTGVMHSHQVVVGALVQSASMAGIRPAANMPTLSGVLADFLQQLINMGGGHPRRTGGLAKQFEESLLAGRVRVERSEANYPSFLYRPEGWEEDLPLMRTSSMVSELAPVVLYLRHVVRSGDVLIVEEPEAHLHPAMQAKFARELARLVRAGVRVVLTTHSEWLLEQIGNLVRLSGLPKERRAGIEGADVALEPSQVGAWLFKPSQRPRGSVVQEVKPDPQTGLFPTDFDDVSMALYNDGAEIFNRLQEEQER